jgi:3-carboxy-cis,cis-muconate cycloisomerase
MTARLIENLATTPKYAEIFANAPLLQAMLDFEAALALAAAKAGTIPAGAVQAIKKAARAEFFDAEQLGVQGLRAGTLAIPLVKALTERVRSADEESARFVHWGATSQDVSDTATVLLLRQARKVLAADSLRLKKALRHASDQYADAVMLGRTLMQAAPPITLGLKIAGWFGAVSRSWARLDAALTDSLVLQFGGASGTLASLGVHAVPVARELAKELDLRLPEAPWHAHRDLFAAVICACGIFTGALGKMAKDVSLLMQSEVSEASEPGGEGRGGSSTMPQKRNPTACALALAAADRVPGYVASFLAGMPQEHERGVGGWHAEAATMARTIEDTGLALESMAEVAEGLSADPARMEKNIADTRGAIFAERAMMKLGPELGRDTAHRLLGEAVQQATKRGCKLTDVLMEMPEVKKVLSKDEIGGLDDPRAYLGAAETFRKQLLAENE